MAKPFQKGSSTIAMCIISWIYQDIYLSETSNKQRARAVAAAPMTTLHAPGSFRFTREASHDAKTIEVWDRSGERVRVDVQTAVSQWGKPRTDKYFCI